MKQRTATSRGKLLTRIITTILAITLSIQFNNIPQTVQAENVANNSQILGSATNDNSGIYHYNGTTGGYATPSALPVAGSRGGCGVIFYLVNSENNGGENTKGTPYKVKGNTQLKPIVFMDLSEREEEGARITTTLNTTRNESITFSKDDIISYPGEDELPKPIKWDGSTWTGNGVEIGEHLLKISDTKTEYGTDVANWEILLDQYGNDDWRDLIDDLRDGTKAVTLCVETLAANYIYRKPIQVEVTNYRKTQTKTTTWTKEVKYSSSTEKNYWYEKTPIYGDWVDQGGAETISTTTYPEGGNGAYFYPSYAYGKPTVFFGTQVSLAERGRGIEQDNSFYEDELQRLRTDVEEPSTAFDTSLITDESSANYVQGNNPVIEEYPYKKNSNGTNITSADEYSVGTTLTRTQTEYQTKEYSDFKINFVDDKIANWKWMQVVLPTSLCLKEKQLGIEVPTKFDNNGLPFSDIAFSNIGYGISMFNDQLVNAKIDTYDGKHSPGNTEPPSATQKGYNYVVKAYMTIRKTIQNGRVISETLEPSGLYERAKKSTGESDTVCNRIHVTNEKLHGSAYHLEHWWRTDTYESVDEKTVYDYDIPGGSLQDGGEPADVTLKGKKGTSECLYVLLVREIKEELKDDGDTIKIQLEQSEITKKVDFNNKVDNYSVYEGSNIFKNYHFRWCLLAYKETEGICPGHNLTSHNNRVDDTVNSKLCTWDWSDRTVEYSLKANNPDNKVFVTKTNWTPIVTKGTGVYTTDPVQQKIVSTRRNASNKDEYQNTKGWNFVAVVHRNNVDKVTAFEWKNNKLGYSANSDLNGIVTVANRKTDNRSTNSQEVENTILHIVQGPLANLNTTRTNTNNQGGGSTNPCANSATRGGNLYEFGNIDDVDAGGLTPIRANKFKVEVTCKVYSGNPSYRGTKTVSNPVTKGRVDSSTLTITPYIFMRYQTTQRERGHNQKLSTVLGNYDRTVSGMYSSAELIDDKNWDKGLIKLDSLQWSTHKRAENNGKVQHGIGTVLPGGATFTLSVPTGNRKEGKRIVSRCFHENFPKPIC